MQRIPVEMGQGGNQCRQVVDISVAVSKEQGLTDIGLRVKMDAEKQEKGMDSRRCLPRKGREANKPMWCFLL